MVAKKRSGEVPPEPFFQLAAKGNFRHKVEDIFPPRENFPCKKGIYLRFSGPGNSLKQNGFSARKSLFYLPEGGLLSLCEQDFACFPVRLLLRALRVFSL